MKLVGIMPVRNEAWCLGFTLRIALKWCDAVCVQLHSCTDASQEIVLDVARETVGERVCWHRVDETEWSEMANRQKLLDAARWLNATHVALIDADEFLTANLVEGGSYSARDYVSGCDRGCLLELPGFNCRGWKAGDYRRYHSNGVWGQRWFATAFHDTPAASWGGDRFHHREPMGVGWNRWRPIAQSQGGTLHLWGASERRLRAKHALYKITERLRWPAKSAAEIEYYYSQATTARPDWMFAPVKTEWMEPYLDLMQHLDIDAEPWQVAQVKRLVLEHGASKFHGLDLLGVAEW